MIYKRLYEFLITKHRTINGKQYAFQKQKSLQDALIDIIDEIGDKLNDKKTVSICLIDIAKAFDSVNHRLLIMKLDKYGIRGIAKKLITSYLENREQVIKNGKVKSEKKTIKNGLPQGTCLAPLLYLIYVNDPIECTKEENTYLYAE